MVLIAKSEFKIKWHTFEIICSKEKKDKRNKINRKKVII